MLKALLLILLLFLFNCKLLIAQVDFRPGFIIENNGDTTRGYINYRSNLLNADRCEFRNSLSSDVKTFTPDAIKSYRLDDLKYYVSRKIVIDSVEKQLFLEYLVDGVIDLFYLATGFENYYWMEKDGKLYPLTNEEKTVTYIPKGYTESIKYGSSRTFIQKSNQYRGMMSVLFQDDREMVKKAQLATYDYKHLIQITKEYHTRVCPDELCIDYSRSIRQKLYIEIFAGGMHSWMHLLEMKGAAKNMGVIGGLNLRIIPVQVFDAWNITTGISLSYNSFDEKKFYYEFPYVDATGLMLYYKYSIIRTPVLLEYNIPMQNKQLQPFITAGFSHSFILSSTHNARYIVKNGSGETTDHVLYEIKNRSMQGGILLGIGFKYHAEENAYYFLKAMAEMRSTYRNTGAVLDSQKTEALIFCFGYGWKL